MPRFPDLATARAGLAEAYAGVTAAVDELDDEALKAATRCDGWARHDLVFHLLCDAQRLLVALATATAAEPTTDAVDYWRPYGGDADDPWQALAHAQFVRLSAAAYSSPMVVVRHWRDTSAAAVRAADQASDVQRYQTQGWVSLPLTTFVVEAALTLSLRVGTPHRDRWPWFGSPGWAAPGARARLGRRGCALGPPRGGALGSWPGCWLASVCPCCRDPVHLTLRDAQGSSRWAPRFLLLFRPCP